MLTLPSAPPPVLDETSPLERDAPARKAAGGSWHGLELSVAVAISLLVVFLHVFFYQHVGGLWRDEVNSLNVATLPTWHELWSFLRFDSVPIVYLGVLRAWTEIFGTNNDPMLRLLGLLIGLGIVGALWLNVRQLGVRAPLLSLGLLGCNSLFVRYADAGRAYGLGTLLNLLTLTAVWRVLAAPRRGRVLLAMAVAVLDVQTVYYNAVLLFAICVAGAVAAAVEKRWRTVGCILSIGLPAALSLLIYTGTVRRVHEWNDIILQSVSLPWLGKKLNEAASSPDPRGGWIWGALVVCALALTGWALRRRPPGTEADPESGAAGEEAAVHGPVRRVAVFAATALVVATVGLAAFFKVLGYPTQPWYYLGYLALAAVCLDGIFGRVLVACAPTYGRFAIVGCAVALAALTFPAAQDNLVARQTNLDLQAAQLEKMAGSEDVIVCTHWEYAVTLAHYYHGKATLLTLLPMDDHRLHRYDLARAQLMRFDPIAPTLARIETTLRGGHRVWVSGGLLMPPDGQEPTILQPGRLTKSGTPDSQAYYRAYVMEAGYFLREHIRGAFPIAASSKQPVMPYEDASLVGFRGWR